MENLWGARVRRGEEVEPGWGWDLEVDPRGLRK